MSERRQKWAEWGEAVGGFSTAFAAIFAVVGAWFAWKQYEANWIIQQEANAKAAYREYLVKAMEFPALSQPGPLAAMPLDDKKRYDWFVAVMLNAFDETLTLAPDDENAREAVASQLAFHAEYLAEADENLFSGYSDQLEALIKAAAKTK